MTTIVISSTDVKIRTGDHHITLGFDNCTDFILSGCGPEGEAIDTVEDNLNFMTDFAAKIIAARDKLARKHDIDQRKVVTSKVVK